MPRKFWKVNIEITNICNLQCSFCPEVIRTKKLMEPDFFREIISQVAPLTRMVALHLMGDPLVHPRLSELVDICHEQGVRIFFVTNGLLLRPKDMQTLLHPTFRQVSFSLHSFADNFGDRDPSAYLDRIFEFTELAFEKRPTLFINYRLWNLGSARGKEDKNLEIFRRIEERFGTPIDRNIDVKIKKNQIIKNQLFLHFDTEFIWPALNLPVLGTTGTCQALSSHIGILVDGTVVPCCLDKEGVLSLGNIREKKLTEIIDGEKARKILGGFKQGRLVEDLCQRCQYIERFKSVVAVRAAATTVCSS